MAADTARAGAACGAAKFAVRGFTEALIEDLRTNAPQARALVVLPGHVGTGILTNSLHPMACPSQPRSATPRSRR